GLLWCEAFYAARRSVGQWACRDGKAGDSSRHASDRLVRNEPRPSHGTASGRGDRTRIHSQFDRTPRLAQRGVIALSARRRRTIETQSAKKRGGGCGIQSEKSRRLATWRWHRRDRITDGI